MSQESSVLKKIVKKLASLEKKIDAQSEQIKELLEQKYDEGDSDIPMETDSGNSGFVRKRVSSESEDTAELWRQMTNNEVRLCTSNNKLIIGTES